VPYAGTTQQIDVVIPDGFYTMSNLNEHLQSILIANGYYLVSGSNNVYFTEFVTNSALYKIEIVCYTIPTTLGSYTSGTATAGWGLNGLPSTANLVPQVIFPSSGGLQSVMGFAAGTFPSSNTSSVTVSSLSTLVPNLTKVNSVIMLCSLVDNKYASNQSTLTAFSPVQTSFGSNIVEKPDTYGSFISTISGTHQGITLSFVDQNYDAMSMNDYNITVSLQLRFPEDK
jgi:hypothetical protein